MENHLGTNLFWIDLGEASNQTLDNDKQNLPKIKKNKSDKYAIANGQTKIYTSCSSSYIYFRMKPLFV